MRPVVGKTREPPTKKFTAVEFGALLSRLGGKSSRLRAMASRFVDELQHVDKKLILSHITAIHDRLLYGDSNVRMCILHILGVHNAWPVCFFRDAILASLKDKSVYVRCHAISVLDETGLLLDCMYDVVRIMQDERTQCVRIEFLMTFIEHAEDLEEYLPDILLLLRNANPMLDMAADLVLHKLPAQLLARFPLTHLKRVRVKLNWHRVSVVFKARALLLWWSRL